MFSLIITIISIALVAALALATLYYGGDAFNRGSDGANAARLINEGQQVNGAVAIARADARAGDGSDLTTWDSLVTGGYLSQLPANLGLDGTATIPTSNAAATKVVSAGICEEVNKRANHTDTDTNTAGIQLAAVTSVDLAPGTYGCATINSVANTFYFKM